jgi:hypothetical protein
MAETKTRASSARSKATKRKPAKARKPSAAKSSNRASVSHATKSRASKTKSSSRSRNGTARKNGTARVEAARNAVEETAKHAGNSVGDAASTVGRAASKAKTPLVASGAAIAGVAGGIALGARQTRRSKLLRGPKVKIDSRHLAKAAKEVGQFGVDVGQLATELRRNREQANGTRSHSRSPIEVVLQGLTSRGKED